MSPPLISLRHVGVRYGARQILDDICLEVGRGEVVALVGESGSGKSTTAKVIAGLLEPSSGEVRVAGRLGMIFQDPFASLNPVHTVRYHLERPLRRHRRTGSARRVGLASDTPSMIGSVGEERLPRLSGAAGGGTAGLVEALLERVGLAPAAEIARCFPHQLSGGQRQRVAIARALAVEPDVLVADEPTSMLDASIRIGILNLLGDLGLAMLLVTHDLASARYLADRTMVMLRGRIVEGGSTVRVMDAPEHEYTRLLVHSASSTSTQSRDLCLAR